MMIVSEELLSEVLDKEVTNIKMHHINDEYIYFDYIGKQSRLVNEVSIDIYKLAHKCKEWAWDNGWIVKSGTTISGFDCEVWGYTFDKRKRLDGESEPEAIFKACQWILDNKDK